MPPHENLFPLTRESDPPLLFAVIFVLIIRGTKKKFDRLTIITTRHLMLGMIERARVNQKETYNTRVGLVCSEVYNNDDY
jgi:hypothetical protein